MNREQLAHVLRASTQIAGDPNILVIGSQAILGSFDEDELPAPSTASREADIAFLNDPGGQKADLVDAAIGELSPFDEQFGYYAQGVEVSTAILPTGWADRLTTWQSRSSGSARSRLTCPFRTSAVVTTRVAIGSPPQASLPPTRREHQSRDASQPTNSATDLGGPRRSEAEPR